MSRPIEAKRPPIKKDLQTFTDEQIRKNVRGQINHIIERIKRPIPTFPDDTRSYAALFRMAQGEYSLLEDRWGDFVGKAETNRSQELAFEVMKTFGFDPNLISGRESRPIANTRMRWDTTTYRSKTIRWLVFDRVEGFAKGVEDYYIGGESRFGLEWRARDESPRFRI